MSANLTELVDGGQPSDDGMVFYHDVSRQSGSVGEDDMVSEVTIMGNVSIGHEEAVMTDDRLSSPRRSPPVQRDILPDDILISQDEVGFFSSVGKGLRRLTHGGKLEDLAFLADLGSFSDEDMGSNPGARPDDGSLFDDRVGTHFDIIINSFWKHSSDVLSRAFKMHDIELPPELFEMSLRQDI